MAVLHEGILPRAREKALHDAFCPWAAAFPQYACTNSGIGGMLAAASFFAPAFVEIDGCIFAEMFVWNHPYDDADAFAQQLSGQFHGDRRAMERWVNAWSVAALFEDGVSALPDSPDLPAQLTDFARCIAYFWEQRLREQFPARSFTFEIGEELEGESGICITFYQKEQ